MKAAGFNVARLAEFAWAKIDQNEGHFDFNWLDRAIETLSAQGIQVVLGTQTASPPPWLMAKQKDLFIVGQDGIRQTYGLRREYCPNHPIYWKYTKRIVSEMTEHYKNNPAVIGWQIFNEFGDRCFCFIAWMVTALAWGVNPIREIIRAAIRSLNPNEGSIIYFMRRFSPTFIVYL